MDIIGSQLGTVGFRGNCVASFALIRDCILKYKLYRQQTLLDAHYIIADHPNYVQLMKTYVKSKCRLHDNYCINVFRDPEFIICGGLQQIYLIVVYYNDEMYVYEIPYIELSEFTEYKLSIYDKWITKYRVLLVMY